MRRRPLPALATLLLVLSTGCPAPAPSVSPEPGRHLLDGTGAEVIVPLRAARIVSLAPDLTQTVSALGSGSRLVGVSAACDRPAELLAGLPRVGTMVEPSIERILTLAPDLVLASADGNPLAALERLRELGAVVYGVKPAAGGLAGVSERVAAVAAAIGREAEAVAAVERLHAELEAARRAAAGRSRLSACWLVWEDPPIAAGGGTFVEALMDGVGLDNACALGGEAWPRLSREQLVVAAPEALLVSSGSHGDLRESLGSWASSLPALGADRVLRVDADRFLRPTLDLGPAASELVEATAPWWSEP